MYSFTWIYLVTYTSICENFAKCEQSNFSFNLLLEILKFLFLFNLLTFIFDKRMDKKTQYRFISCGFQCLNTFLKKADFAQKNVNQCANIKKSGNNLYLLSTFAQNLFNRKLVLNTGY